MAGRLGAPNSGRVTTSSFIGDMSPVATDGFFLIPYKASEITDGIITSDPLSVNWNLSYLLTEGVELTEPQVTLLVTVLAEAIDTFELEDVFENVKWLTALSDGIAVEDAEFPSAVFSESTAFGLNITEAVRIAYPLLIVDALQMAATLLSPEQKHSINLEELINASEVYAAKGNYSSSATDTTTLIASIFVGYAVSASDDITIEDVMTAVRAVAIADVLNIKDVLTAVTTYSGAYTEGVRLTDSLVKFLSGTITESVGIDSSWLPTVRAAAQATDSVGVQDVLSQKLIIRLVATDSFNIDDADVIKMLFSPTLIDGVHISAAYIAPGDNFTTWTINTRTGATTEYTNFVFNSFAKFGNTYLGANSEGLFELQGTTDAGTDIVAAIKSGLMQMASTRFTMFRAAYLGIRGEGDFVLRLVSGDGDVFNYSFNANSMITTKVPLGKGLRARYFSFELISDENDFDMESIEFIPLAAQRRV